jgi:hypothetical protein
LLQFPTSSKIFNTLVLLPQTRGCSTLHPEGAVLLEDLWSRQSRSSRSGRHFPYSQGVSRPTRHKVREFPRLVPEYRIVGLLDSQNTNLEGSDKAITESVLTIAALAPSGLYLSVNQDQLPVDLELVIWDGPPPENLDPAAGWTRAGTFTMPFPSGDIALGDLGGRAIGGPWLRERTGSYTVEVWSRGRDEAATRRVEMFAETADMTTREARAYVHRHGAGIEQYHLRLWPHEDKPSPPSKA